MSALRGIRVLDFGRFVAGPYCATILADFGADVIRIEPPGGGEDRFLAPVMDSGEGAIFMQVARNKRSLTLDMRSDSGRDIVNRLVATADIVVTNMARSVLPRLGLDHETLSSIKPDIITVNTSAFGDRGEWANLPGFDSVGQAMSGGIYMSGEPGNPTRATVNWVDYGSSLHAALGALLALRERDLSGRGQEVSTSLLGTAVSFQNPILIDQMMLQLDRKPTGNRGFASGPTDVFKVSDGWIICHVVSNPIFKRWARLMGEEEIWLEDPRFATDQLRGQNSEALSERMAKWCASRSRDQALAELAEAKVPGAPVLAPKEVIAHPQIRELGLLTPIEYDGKPTPVSVSATPIEMSVSPAKIQKGPPTVGEHSDEILLELGLSESEIEALRSFGVV